MRQLSALVLAAGMMFGEGKAQNTSTVFYRGDDLLHFCSQPEGTDFGMCRGFVVGIANVMANGEIVRGHRACIPEGISVEQAADIVKLYLEHYPRERHLSASG